MAVLDLHFCMRAFSSCGKRGPFFIAVRRPLTIAAPPVAEHRLQTRRLSSCGSRAHLLRGMWDLPRPGLEPVSPAWAGRFSTTEPPGKPTVSVLNENSNVMEAVRRGLTPQGPRRAALRWAGALSPALPPPCSLHPVPSAPLPPPRSLHPLLSPFFLLPTWSRIVLPFFPHLMMCLDNFQALFFFSSIIKSW